MTREEILKLLNYDYTVLRRYYETENLKGKVRPHIKTALKNTMLNNICIGYSWRTQITFDTNKELDLYMENELKKPFIIEDK